MKHRYKLRRGTLATWLLSALAGIFLSAMESWSADSNVVFNPFPAYPDAAGQLVWDTLRGHFRMSFSLEPGVTAWHPVKAGHSVANGQYEGGGYRFKLSEKAAGKNARLVSYELTRTDGQPFRILENCIECKTSYSGVYKIFEPGSFSQQNYKLDLPFHIDGEARAEVDQPLIWMQQTDGRNTLALGLLDQLIPTTFEGSTYDVGNGGEAPGIANSYVRVALRRTLTNDPPRSVFRDTLYVNADASSSWFEALEGYSAAVDADRGFMARPISKWALNPMWHSWYAHGDKIDEAQIRDDARRARRLGATTVELDAGWNMPREVSYSFDNEGDYTFDRGRFPDPNGMIEDMHAAGQRVVLHVAPLLMGKNSKAWTEMKDCLLWDDGKPDVHLDPRLKKVHQYLLGAWERLFTQYGVDGLWYDFLELPARADPPPAGMVTVSADLHAAYTQLLQALFDKSLTLNSNAVIILRRPSANLNAKLYCTHVWPMDAPQDYNMNRRDVVYMKTFGPGVLTHACCTCWAITESDMNVARQMASVVLAGVPAFSVKLPESPASHNAIIKAWLAFYEPNKRDLVLGRMTPLLPTPPSAALRIEAEKQAFFGFFEALPGLVEVTRSVNKITLVNAFSKRTVTRLEGVDGEWQVQLYDEAWQPIFKTRLKSDDARGLNINLAAPSECHVIVLTKEL